MGQRTGDRRNYGRCNARTDGQVEGDVKQYMHQRHEERPAADTEKPCQQSNTQTEASEGKGIGYEYCTCHNTCDNTAREQGSQRGARLTNLGRCVNIARQLTRMGAN